MPAVLKRALFDPLEGEDTVFRVAIEGKSYLPTDAVLPTDGFFTPSNEDEREAAERGRPISLSCWDLAVTTVEQASRIRLNGGPEGHKARSFALGVGRIRELGSAQNIPLNVVDDRHDPDEEGEGAEGHCAIVGLARDPKVGTKLQYRELRLSLARACREIE